MSKNVSMTICRPLRLSAIHENSSTSRSYYNAVVGFILVYAISWTAASSLLDPSVPYDAVEALNWAKNAEFGTPKNPYVVGLVMAAGRLFEPLIPINVYWYLSHFVGVAVGMFGVWLLGRRLFGRNDIALLSLMSLNLSGIINIDAIPYNDNYLLVMFWPYLFLFFIKSIYDNKYHWFSLAIVAGLGTMSKYSTFVFLPFMFIYTLVVPEARKAYVTATFYCSILLFLTLLAPNAVWLYEHHYAAFEWVKSEITPGFSPKATIAFLAVFYPALLLSMILVLLGGRTESPDTSEKKAILFVFTPPVLLIAGYFLFQSGGRITEWLQPFAVLTPVVLLSVFNMSSVRSIHKVTASFLAVSIAVCLGYVLAMQQNIGGVGTKHNYLKPLCADLNALWRDKYHKPLIYVGGGTVSHWLTFYAPDRPSTTMRWSNDKRPNIYNPRITTRDILKYGALFVGDYSETEQLAEALSSYPELTGLEWRDYIFRSDRGRPVRLRVVFSPPHKEHRKWFARVG